MSKGSLYLINQPRGWPNSS